MTTLAHFVAHTRHGWRGVLAQPHASWLWNRLRARFPDAVAAVLMPDHLHILMRELASTLDALRRTLQHHSRKFGVRWDLGPVQPCHTREIGRRAAGYIVLNPPRAGLVDDPLRWRWSTLRDAIGATAEPWGDASTLRRHLGWSGDRLWRRAARDESCAIAAREPLQELGTGGLAVGIDVIAAACAQAWRRPVTDLRQTGSPVRPTFVALAGELGVRSAEPLALACGTSVRAIHQLRKRATPDAVAAARRCVADPRLRLAVPADASTTGRAPESSSRSLVTRARRGPPSPLSRGAGRSFDDRA